MMPRKYHAGRGRRGHGPAESDARTSGTSASAAKSQSKRSLESNPSVGCSVSWFATRKPKEDPHARNCEGCDVARSNGEHQGPRKAQRHKEIEDLHPGQGEERDAKKAKEEIVKNVTESMHECN